MSARCDIQKFRFIGKARTIVIKRHTFSTTSFKGWFVILREQSPPFYNISSKRRGFVRAQGGRGAHHWSFRSKKVRAKATISPPKHLPLIFFVVILNNDSSSNSRNSQNRSECFSFGGAGIRKNAYDTRIRPLSSGSRH